MEGANLISVILGNALRQDSVRVEKPDHKANISKGVIVRRKDGSEFSLDELNDLHSRIGVFYSTSDSGKAVKFIDSAKWELGDAYGKDNYSEFATKFATLGSEFKMTGFSQQDELIEAKNEGYEKAAEAVIGRGAGANPERLGYRYGTRGPSDLQRRTLDLLYTPT